MPSIFSRIIAGEIPCQKVYENAHVLAFLDINPLTDGHTLVVPKHEVERLDQLAPDEAAELGKAVAALGGRVARAVGAAGYNVLQNNGRVSGQEVPHVHFHIIPRHEGDGLGYRWRPQKRTPEQLAQMRSKIEAAG